MSGTYVPEVTYMHIHFLADLKHWTPVFAALRRLRFLPSLVLD
jgi:hypothetical protein